MHVKSVIKSVPFLGPLAARLYGQLRHDSFRDSADYWEKRYRHGGSSGAGSYNHLARFKATVLNEFVAQEDIRSVIEFGSGDGAQLELADYPAYVGVDISRTVIDLAKARFAADPSKSFFQSSDAPANLRADLSLSLDVVYHLVEDAAFVAYMRSLFDAATRFVIIYASNHDAPASVPHVRHRCFTRWVEEECSDFRLVKRVANELPFDADDQDNTSFADFYIFQRTQPR